MIMLHVSLLDFPKLELLFFSPEKSFEFEKYPRKYISLKGWYDEFMDPSKIDKIGITQTP